jgi:hypothetical protein
MPHAIHRELSRARRTMQMTTDPMSAAALNRYVVELESKLQSSEHRSAKKAG